MIKDVLKEYFKFADSLGMGNEHNGKTLDVYDLEAINNKRDELFGEDWKY